MSRSKEAADLARSAGESSAPKSTSRSRSQPALRRARSAAIASGVGTGAPRGELVERGFDLAAGALRGCGFLARPVERAGGGLDLLAEAGDRLGRGQRGVRESLERDDLRLEPRGGLVERPLLGLDRSLVLRLLLQAAQDRIELGEAFAQGLGIDRRLAAQGLLALERRLGLPLARQIGAQAFELGLEGAPVLAEPAQQGEIRVARQALLELGGSRKAETLGALLDLVTQALRLAIDARQVDLRLGVLPALGEQRRDLVRPGEERLVDADAVALAAELGKRVRAIAALLGGAFLCLERRAEPFGKARRRREVEMVELGRGPVDELHERREAPEPGEARRLRRELLALGVEPGLLVPQGPRCGN